ncbi:hypothetical protein ACFZCP_05255 [Streptomyces sp. NPDC007971]|uniref:hypothetical protein n=1 Tax=Streptomyces sp. NPDC007971 TaxID=3364799 RepID=UPI0036E861B1
MSAKHLSGNYAPVTEELTAHDLPVTGTLPPEPAGWYLRNGPNPADAACGHSFFGGRLHTAMTAHPKTGPAGPAGW